MIGRFIILNFNHLNFMKRCMIDFEFYKKNLYDE